MPKLRKNHNLKSLIELNLKIFFYKFRRKKKLLKEKQKLNERRKLNMIHDGDEPTIGEDFEIFSLKTIQKAVMKAKARALAAADAVSSGKNIMLDSDNDLEEDEDKEENDGNVSTSDDEEYVCSPFFFTKK